MSKITTFILAFYFFSTLSSSAQVNEMDSLAMVDLYHALDGDNWTNNTNWLSEKRLEEWYGIYLNNNKVVLIDLKNNNCAGSIPSSLSNCDELVEIFIPENKITGVEANDSFHFLTHVNLSSNEISEFPTFIAKCINLERINLYSNAIKGSIPSELNELPQLRELFLSKNQFSGIIPSFTALKNLSEVDFSLNPELLGNINNVFFDTLKIEKLDLSKTDISGHLKPTYFTRESNLYLFADSSKISSISQLEDFSISKAWFRETDLGFDELVDFQNTNAINQFYYTPQNLVEGEDYIEAAIGQTIQLTCNIEDAEAIQWFKDQQIINGETNSTLQIIDVSLEDEGIYYCTGTHSSLPQLTIKQSNTQILTSSTSTSNSSLQKVVLTPNPAQTYISILNLNHRHSTIKIFDSTGNEIYNAKAKANQSIDIEYLNPGVYYMKVIDNRNGNVKTLPFINQ